MGQAQSQSSRQTKVQCMKMVRETEACIRTIKAASFADLVKEKSPPKSTRAARCADLSSPAWYAKRYAKNPSELKRQLLASQRESLQHTKTECRGGTMHPGYGRYLDQGPDTLWSMLTGRPQRHKRQRQRIDIAWQRRKAAARQAAARRRRR